MEGARIVVLFFGAPAVDKGGPLATQAARLTAPLVMRGPQLSQTNCLGASPLVLRAETFEGGRRRHSRGRGCIEAAQSASEARRESDSERERGHLLRGQNRDSLNTRTHTHTQQGKGAPRGPSSLSEVTGLRCQQQRLLVLVLVVALLLLLEGLDAEAGLLFAVRQGPSWGPPKFRCQQILLSKLTIACPLAWGAPAAAAKHGTFRAAHKDLNGVVFPQQQQQQQQQQQEQQQQQQQEQQQERHPFHTPVMLEESVSLLLGGQPDEPGRGPLRIASGGPSGGPPARPRIFVDCTAGGGGHAAAIAQRISKEDVLVCCDIDGEAIAAARERLCSSLHEGLSRPSNEGAPSSGGPSTGLELGGPHKGPQIRFVQGSFRFLRELVFAATGKEGDAVVDGHRLGGPLLLSLYHDLPATCSSVANHCSSCCSQVYVHRKSVDLARAQLSPTELLQHGSGLLLQRVLRQLGEEPLAKRITRALVSWQQQYQQQQQQQQQQQVMRIEDLVELVVGCTPQTSRKKTHKILSRVFQALRMFVNEEVLALQQLLLQSLSLLRPGGRLLLLSFHSIEDSIAASAFARHKVRPAAAAAAPEAAAAASATARAAGPLIEDGFRLSRSMGSRALEASQQGACWRPLFKQQQLQQQQQMLHRQQPQQQQQQHNQSTFFSLYPRSP
ncbi:hypothetical protein Emed_003892 [Eimeria media]